MRACNQLGQFLTHRETNLRYLALESMCLLATSEFSHDAVKKHQETVINALKTERDVSVRQRAVDLLYAMCDRYVKEKNSWKYNGFALLSRLTLWFHEQIFDFFLLF